MLFREWRATEFPKCAMISGIPRYSIPETTSHMMCIRIYEIMYQCSGTGVFNRRLFALKGQDRIAQGNALGTGAGTFFSPALPPLRRREGGGRCACLILVEG